MPLRSLFLFSVLLFFLSPAAAQSFDGRYDGNLLLTRDGGDCGDKIQKFQAEIKGNRIRITSARADKPLDGEIESDGRFFVGGPGRGHVKLEFRAQILATKSGLGSLLLLRGETVCQFLLSLKQI